MPDLLAGAGDQGLVANQVRGIIVVRQRDYVFWQSDDHAFQYHPGMAVHRIKFLAEGQPDPMVDAMQLAPGDTVLDCTLGLGSDALVASFVVGDSGRVRGLEASLPVALVVHKGIQTYSSNRKAIVPALRRVSVQAARAENVLASLPAASWDIVYFDPMFTSPVAQSVGIAPLRAVADPSPLTLHTIQAAAQVARRAVVVKDRVNGPWLSSARFTRRVGGANRRVGYAVLEGDELVRMAEGAG